MCVFLLGFQMNLTLDFLIYRVIYIFFKKPWLFFIYARYIQVNKNNKKLMFIITLLQLYHDSTGPYFVSINDRCWLITTTTTKHGYSKDDFNAIKISQKYPKDYTINENGVSSQVCIIYLILSIVNIKNVFEGFSIQRKTNSLVNLLVKIKTMLATTYKKK